MLNSLTNFHPISNNVFIDKTSNKSMPTPLQMWYFQNSSFACPVPSFSCDSMYFLITSSFIPTVDIK